MDIRSSDFLEVTSQLKKRCKGFNIWTYFFIHVKPEVTDRLHILWPDVRCGWIVQDTDPGCSYLTVGAKFSDLLSVVIVDMQHPSFDMEGIMYRVTWACIGTYTSMYCTVCMGKYCTYSLWCRINIVANLHLKLGRVGVGILCVNRLGDNLFHPQHRHKVNHLNDSVMVNHLIENREVMSAVVLRRQTIQTLQQLHIENKQQMEWDNISGLLCRSHSQVSMHCLFFSS